MSKCIRCGRDAGYEFRALEVHTLHVRDLKGDKRVQALGEERELALCGQCAGEWLRDIRSPGKKLMKSCVIFGIIGLMGIVAAALFWRGEGALRLLGLGAVACCALGLYGKLRAFDAKKKDYAAQPEDVALYHAAWECAVDAAPKKYAENDVTYIPMDAETLSRKNGDLMILYELLPQIAVQAYERIHGADAGNMTDNI